MLSMFVRSLAWGGSLAHYMSESVQWITLWITTFPEKSSERPPSASTHAYTIALA